MEADREEQEMEVEALQSILDEKFTVLGDSARVARSAGGEGEGLQWYQIEQRPFEDEEDEDEQPVEGERRARRANIYIYTYIRAHVDILTRTYISVHIYA